MLAIKSNRIVTPQAIYAGAVLIRGNKILKVETKPLPPSLSPEVLDYRDSWILPGFIDLHIHGFQGFPVGSCPRALDNLAGTLAKTGVTSFMPALTCSCIDEMKKALQVVSTVPTCPHHSQLLGIHLEGPFLNRKKRGAIPASLLRLPSTTLMAELEKCTAGLKLRVTLAPELPGALELITYLRGQGHLVSAGHTAASYNQTRAAIAAGVSIANHLFNAMDPLHHREPGAVGAFLSDDRVSCELIGDGIHLHPAIIDLVLRCKGIARVFMVSDAIPAAGLAPGNYTFSNQKITITKAGKSFLMDGTIAGSTVNMLSVFRYLLTNQISITDACKLTAGNPARIAGFGETKGEITRGKDADLVILDANYRLQAVILRGQVIESTCKEGYNAYPYDGGL